MKTRTVTRDGVLVVKGQCPTCKAWADLDDDQLHGRVSIQCTECGFHETIKILP